MTQTTSRNSSDNGINKEKKKRFLELVQKVFRLVNGEGLSPLEDQELYGFLEFLRHQLLYNNRAYYMGILASFSEEKRITFSRFEYKFYDFFIYDEEIRKYDLQMLKELDMESKMELLNFLIKIPLDFNNQSRISDFAEFLYRINHLFIWMKVNPLELVPEARDSIFSLEDVEDEINSIFIEMKELLE